MTDWSLQLQLERKQEICQRVHVVTNNGTLCIHRHVHGKKSIHLQYEPQIFSAHYDESIR
jgi:hypothetical protein